MVSFDWLHKKRARNAAIYGTEWLDELADAQKKLRPTEASLIGAGLFGLIVRPSVNDGPIWAVVVLFSLMFAGLVFLVPYVRAMRSVSRRARQRRLAWQRNHPGE